MPIGNTLLAIACAMAAIATVGYGMTLFNRNSLVSLARKAYYVFAAAVVLMCVYFLQQILNHNFSLIYVYDYSSRDLGLGFLISTFWAGQVGSFTLWLLCIAIIGVFLIRRESENHSAVMFFYMLVVSFFLTLLVAKSPFLRFAPEVLAQFPGGAPPDGQGLNPLLQNYWMVIHPPIVFIGFSLLAVPFAFALGALARNNYRDWVKNSFPWTAIASFFLGAGIFLGGYWAYETLGWGGYWAWDPVENTSLIPWLLNLALMHGLLIERSRGVFRRSNLMLAMFSFLLVIYGTFLTRSGVLADFSVHSFTDLGISGYLIFFLVFFLALSVLLLAVRAKHAKTGADIKDPYSVDFAIVIGIFFLLLLSALTLVGTSAPLITRFLTAVTAFCKENLTLAYRLLVSMHLAFEGPANVSAEFYNTTTLPMAIIMALLAGLSPFFAAKEKNMRDVMRLLLIPEVLSLIVAVISIFFGVTNRLYLLMIFYGCFALFANIAAIYFQPGRVGLRIGGFITHMGFGIMMIGIVVSSAFSETEKINLYAGQDPVGAFQYKISYKGMAGEATTKDNYARLEVDDQGERFQADPKLFIAKENQGMMRKPYIRKHLLYDLYLSPQDQQITGEGNQLVLSKGETGKIGDYGVKFVSFDMGNHGNAGDMQVGAVLEVTRGSETKEVVPRMEFTRDGKQFLKADMPNGDGSITLKDIQADAGKVSLAFSGVPGMDIMDLLVLEVSKKPLINLVWLGVVMVCGGTFISYVRRRRLREQQA
jgi:cytochrome c-type biogenesis protein CcmF